MNIVREDPTPSLRGRRGSRDWEQVATQLKAEPGVWFNIGTDLPISIGTNIQTARLRSFAPAGTYEATIRGRNEAGRAKAVFARYVGE
jgi:hypothetical protein